MARALVQITGGLPLVAPFPPFELLYQPGAFVWDDDPLIFSHVTRTLDGAVRGRLGIILRQPPCQFAATEETSPTTPTATAQAIYDILGYDPSS